VVGYHVAIDYAEAVRNGILNGSLQQFVGWLGAQLRDGICPCGLNEFDAVLFSDLQRLWAKGRNRGKRPAALADCARK